MLWRCYEEWLDELGFDWEAWDWSWRLEDDERNCSPADIEGTIPIPKLARLDAWIIISGWKNKSELPHHNLIVIALRANAQPRSHEALLSGAFGERSSSFPSQHLLHLNHYGSFHFRQRFKDAFPIGYSLRSIPSPHSPPRSRSQSQREVSIRLLHACTSTRTRNKKTRVVSRFNSCFIAQRSDWFPWRCITNWSSSPTFPPIGSFPCLVTTSL